MKRAQPMMKSWHVATAAEAFAAAQFARLGWDVSVQYGANQPEYDLVVVAGDRVLKVSVKGSQKGAWGLAQSYLGEKKAGYHRAADKWLAKHTKKTVFCLVQFKGVGDDALPRMYLATPAEIADRLKKSAAGRGATILYEKHRWSERATGAGPTDRIPESWRLTKQRIDEILGKTDQPVSGDHV
jgi:Holliday junction resolvase-like predicted endonuclease